MKRLTTLFFPTTLALALIGSDVGAVSTRTWTTGSYSQFDKGEADNALISSQGEVMPGLSKKRVNVETDALWSIVQGKDGTLYASGVGDGNIYAIKNGKSKKLASLSKHTPWVGAMALAKNGSLFVGTLGTGTVLEVNTKTGKSTKVAALKDVEHIWALAFDASETTLYAATGPKGQLFAVNVRKRSAKKIWESEEKHLLSMIRAKDGALWLGTADEAILYRFDPKKNKARAIADFAGTEVKAIVEVNGGFVVASNEFEHKSSAVPGTPPGIGKGGDKGKAPKKGTMPGADKVDLLPKRKGATKSSGALFRVEPSGRVEQLHALAEGYFMSLTADANGNVFAGSGSKGRVYQVTPDRAVLTVFDVSERQVNAVLATGGGLAFATGDAGAAYTSAGPAKKATYTSDVFDAKSPSRWGRVRWRASGQVSMETRSGNTSKPGLGWSAWQKPRSGKRGGGDATVAQVTSLPGRYLQYRVSWSGKSVAKLHDVSVYYLPQNQRARISSIAVAGSSDGGDSGWITTKNGPTKPRSPILRLSWEIDNPDADKLVYTVEYRPDGEVDWRRVPTGKRSLTSATFQWNTEALPDGYYKLRVTATDARANPKDLALSHTLVSSSFLVDNQKPTVAGVTTRYPFISGRATDSFSRIDEIAYQVNDGNWVIVFPKDGIFDDLTESFTAQLPKLAPGSHIVSIRTADEAHNIGSTSLKIRVR